MNRRCALHLDCFQALHLHSSVTKDEEIAVSDDDDPNVKGKGTASVTQDTGAKEDDEAKEAKGPTKKGKGAKAKVRLVKDF